MNGLRTFVFLTVLLLPLSTTFGRIGETVEQLNKRYGKPGKNDREAIDTRRRYSFHGFSIVVGLENGVSQCEVYLKQDHSRMSQAEVYGLLEVNTGTSGWRWDPDENENYFTYWSQDKKSRVAIYILATHQLMITSKPYLKKFAEFLSSGTKRTLNGF